MRVSFFSLWCLTFSLIHFVTCCYFLTTFYVLSTTLLKAFSLYYANYSLWIDTIPWIRLFEFYAVCTLLWRISACLVLLTLSPISISLRHCAISSYESLRLSLRLESMLKRLILLYEVFLLCARDAGLLYSLLGVVSLLCDSVRVLSNV